ncbi:MAG: enoyl-CoA hydratase/isomerase family protein [Ruminococcaceae bacterium]|nr:enoyl-CoA hydratase/isomerase family protein [Oscillospiraceae bacterium]
MALVELEQRGHVGLITINRPEVLNALNVQALRELDDILDRVESDEEIYVLIITGAGRAFVAGADIGEMVDFTAADAKTFSRRGNNVLLRMTRFPRPIIAAINGYALGGGCELAMSCDIRIGSEHAKFGMPEVGLGITPGFGGTQRLARIVGMSTATELVLTGRTIDAQEALQIGLINHLYPAGEMLDRAFELAQIIASKAQVAVRQVKQAIRIGTQIDMSSALAFESEAFGLCFSTEDQKDSMQAFLNKEQLSGYKNR